MRGLQLHTDICLTVVRFFEWTRNHRFLKEVRGTVSVLTNIVPDVPIWVRDRGRGRTYSQIVVYRVSGLGDWCTNQKDHTSHEWNSDSHTGPGV